MTEKHYESGSSPRSPTHQRDAPLTSRMSSTPQEPYSPVTTTSLDRSSPPDDMSLTALTSERKNTHLSNVATKTKITPHHRRRTAMSSVAAAPGDGASQSRAALAGLV